MLRTTSIAFYKKDFRRDRRYAVPSLTAVIGDDDYVVRNWSLGGLLLDPGPAVAIGHRLHGQLIVPGRDGAFLFTVEAVRRGAADGTLACRFVDPSPAMVDALDMAIARRFHGGRRARSAAIVGALLLAASQALAAGPTLVPGAAPLPQFRLSFPTLLAGPPTVGTSGLEISLTSPDHGVLQFLFSPRSQFDITTDRDTGASRSMAGLSWNLFDNGGFYGNLDVGGSVTRPGLDEMFRHNFGPPLALHGGVEFGYELGGPNSLTLSLDHATAPDYYAEHGDLNNLRLRYGLKF
jgi:hypothetical protein